jgi:putative methionine-R-sulfoxide reductase with GAF domain
MSPDTLRIPKRSTDRLSRDERQETAPKSRLTYQPMPFSDITETDDRHPVWRVRFDLTTDASVSLGLEINGEVVFGRGPGGPEHLDLIPYGAHENGVSRRHAILRPTHSKLFVIDLDSTNGTFHNGADIRDLDGPCMLHSGDTLTLGGLEFAVTIVKRPTDTGQLQQKADLSDALAMQLTSAGEMSIWLVDEDSEELFLEAERGIQDEKIKLMRMAVDNSLVGQVIRTGVSLRDSREPSGNKIKVKTGYLVEAVLYVPLTLEDKAIGVIGATHREMGKAFDERDERLLEAIGVGRDGGHRRAPDQQPADNDPGRCRNPAAGPLNETRQLRFGAGDPHGRAAGESGGRPAALHGASRRRNAAGAGERYDLGHA